MQYSSKSLRQSKQPQLTIPKHSSQLTIPKHSSQLTIPFLCFAIKIVHAAVQKDSVFSF